MADLTNGAAASIQAPLPQIVVTLRPQPTGVSGQVWFDVEVTMMHMPGGWRMAHHGLCLALEQVLPMVEQQAKNEGAIRVVQQVPDGLSIKH